MGYVQNKRAGVIQLLGGTFSQLWGVKREAAIYMAVFVLAAIIADLNETVKPVVSVLSLFGYFVGQYWLYRQLMSRAGVIYDRRWRVISLFAMALVLSIPIGFGLQFFVLPGIVLAAKWIMAPSYLASENMGFLQAIGESWRASRENTISLTVALSILSFAWCLIFMIVAISYQSSSGDASFGDEVATAAAENGSRPPEALIWAVLHLLPVLLAGFSMAAFRALSDHAEQYAEIFE